MNDRYQMPPEQGQAQRAQEEKQAGESKKHVKLGVLAVVILVVFVLAIVAAIIAAAAGIVHLIMASAVLVPMGDAAIAGSAALLCL